MDFDLFISHSSKDKHIADQVCATLERAGIRCWIAPRDIKPGDEYGAAIVHAIDSCRAMVLIFSSNANVSRQVPRELERGVSRGIPILPVRIEDVAAKDSLAYFVGSVQWFDAIKPPLEDHLQELAGSAYRLLRGKKWPGDARPDQSPERATMPVAMQFDRARSPFSPATGRVAVASLMVCAGLLLVAFTASRWFGKEVGPPVAAVAERGADAAVKTPTEAPAKTPPAQVSQGASKIAEAPKADMPTAVVDDPVVKEAIAMESGRPAGSGTADAPSTGSPKAAATVAVTKDVPSPDVTQQPAGAQPSSATSSGVKDSAYFTAADANRVERVAAAKKFPLPKYQIAEIDPDVPAKFRRYIGIWATKTGFNGGAGREGMLIVSDVDTEGKVNGAYMLGPPTATSFQQQPAFSRPIFGTIKNDVLSIVVGNAMGTVSFASSNNLLVKFVRQNGPTAIATFYPIWMLSEREGALPATQTRKSK